MSISSTILGSSRASTPLASLVNSGCNAVGGIFHLNYSQAVVLTDDWRKTEAGGVPHGAFLLAAAGTNTAEGFALDDEELILLRVSGTAPLPNESDLVQTRLAVVRDAGVSGKGFDEVTDELTRNELQQSAFNCEVVGTFYVDRNETKVQFGSDIDNVVSSARYQVFLPSPDVLSWVASYPEPDGDNLLTLGSVRFASTRRRARESGTDRAAVNVHIDDFVARKTAVFGMTRTGKSNTIKTLVAAIAFHSARAGAKVGQLIFDPQGEYANVNEQDKTGLRLLGDGEDTVRIYKVDPDPSDTREKTLRLNFYDRDVLDAVWGLVSDATAAVNTNYAKSFRAADLTEPDVNDHGAHNRWGWALVAFYGLLARCGFMAQALPQPLLIALPADKATDFITANPNAIVPAGRGKFDLSSPEAALSLATWIAARPDEFPKWHDENSRFPDIAGVYDYTGVTSAIRTIRPFHGTVSTGDVAEQLWQDMVEGRLAIVDLSSGNELVAKVMSERIVTHLLNRAGELFRANEDPVKLQIVVEEAHNLFERGGKDVADNPWVRLSKEAAKYKMGLVYATQEVTSVDQRILSNTSNWLVAHLNSDKETNELSHYYDFRTWGDSLRRIEDQGFVRMKTHSGKYIVPVQITKFDHAMINAARIAAGLKAVEVR